MKWTIRGILLITMILATALVANAQDTDIPLFEYIPAGVNNPWVNDLANACYVGGTLSGKCNNTDVNDDNIVTEFDREWMWNAGWHLIRQEYNVFSTDGFDDAYEQILPENTQRPIDSMNTGCYEVIYEGVPERWILWRGGGVQTAELYFNDQCEGPRFFLENVIAVETYEQADAACKRDRGRYLYPDRFASSFYRCVYYRPDFTNYPENTNPNPNTESE